MWKHFNVWTFDSMEVPQSVFIAADEERVYAMSDVERYSCKWVHWCLTIIAQRLQLNCQLNVKITNHSNGMKLKMVDSIAMVVTPLLLLLLLRRLWLQYWITKWRTFITFFFAPNRTKLYAGSIRCHLHLDLFSSITAMWKCSINAYSWLNFIVANRLQSSLNCMHSVLLYIYISYCCFDFYSNASTKDWSQINWNIFIFE